LKVDKDDDVDRDDVTSGGSLFQSSITNDHHIHHAPSLSPSITPQHFTPDVKLLISFTNPFIHYDCFRCAFTDLEPVLN